MGSPDRRAYKEKFATKNEAYKKELEKFKASGGADSVVDTKVKRRRITPNNQSRVDPEEKRKKEDDAAQAAIDCERASRGSLAGA